MSSKIGADQKQLIEQMYYVYQAVLEKNHKQLAILLRNAKFNIINNKDLRKSALDIAAKLGDQVSVELLLAHGAIPDYGRRLHFWPLSTLSQAIINGNHKVIQLLVNQGCDPDIYLYNVTWPLIIPFIKPSNYWNKVVELNLISIFRLFLECKGKKIINDKENQKMLLLASSMGSSSIMDYLLDQGVSIESTDENGWTCIFHAAANMRINDIKMLLARHANVNHKDFRGRTPLHIVIYYHKKNCSKPMNDIVKLLVNYGTDINAVDKDGLTPINMIYSIDVTDNRFHNTILFLLSQSKIDLTKPDINGTTVLHRCLSSNTLFGLKKMLHSLNVDINARDNENRTPLQLAKNSAIINHLPLLLDFGADTEALNHLSKDWFKNQSFIFALREYERKRNIAGLEKDKNVDNILTEYPLTLLFNRCLLSDILSLQVIGMKKTILYDKLTYFNFLHSKKFNLVKIAFRPEMREIFMKRKHEFSNYGNLLCKNYLNGVKLLIQIESNAEKNLNVIFKNKLPNLVVCNIKKYFDVKDLITLNNKKLFD